MGEPAAPDRAAPDPAAEYRLELYRSLRDEAGAYIKEIPALWLQKFVLTGATIGFIVAQFGWRDGAGGGGPGSLAVRQVLTGAVVAIPVLASFIDARILEYGVHARAVSRFVAETFRETDVVPRWERVLWGDDGGEEIVRLVRVRIWMSFLVTALPTMLLFVLASLAVGALWGRVGLGAAAAAVTAAGYFAVTAFAYRRLWPPRMRAAFGPARRPGEGA